MARKLGALLLIVFSGPAIGSATCLAHGLSDEKDEQGIIVQRDQPVGVTTIIVPSRNGSLFWSDVLVALSRAGGLEPTPAPWELDGAHIDLSAQGTQLSMLAISAAVPDVSMRVTRHPHTEEPALLIRIAGDDLRAKARSVKAMLRVRFGSKEHHEHGLRLDEGWKDRPSDRPLVVLVHGYSSRGDSLDVFRSELAQRNWPCAVFGYPNDGPLAESGALLAAELREFGRSHPDRQVAIVAHSMGGLVSRVAIEDPRLDPGNICQLIMVCTPNHGSQWARLPGGLDCWELLPRWREETLREAFRASVADGLNEARRDLQPESRFLRDLNARPRNAKVRYALILGTGARFTEEQIDQLQQRVVSELERDRHMRMFRSLAETFFSDLEELQAERGDWAVAVKRGRLDGVEDTLLLPVAHWDFTSDRSTAAQSELFTAICDRLAR